jgi:energy-coupling factor transporter ATP-binding protein EcfA2
MSIVESLVVRSWNACASPKRPEPREGLTLGSEICETQVIRIPVRLPHQQRAEHVVVLGRTGSGKSSLLNAMARQDVRERRGFLVFDHHGDTTPFVLGLIAAEEQRTGVDLSPRLILIEPGDPDYSVGLNVLEPDGEHPRFRQIAECAAILKQRWQLDTLGARTEELLRNALYVLSENKLTLVEVGPLLTSAPFRARLLRSVENDDVRSFFASRYNAAKPGMQAAMSGPVLNKSSAFTADPHFRHLLGQPKSTFSISHALDRGFWILLNLDKGRLGPESGTAASLFLAKICTRSIAMRSRIWSPTTPASMCSCPKLANSASASRARTSTWISTRPTFAPPCFQSALTSSSVSPAPTRSMHRVRSTAAKALPKS